MADTKVNVNMIGDGQVATNTIAPDAVTTAKVVDGTLTNADFSPTANISVSKLNSPGSANDFLRGDGVFATSDPNAIDEVAFNIGVLGFKMAVNEGLTVFNLVDGVVDEFNDESGVDTAENTNSFYDSSSDFYANQVNQPVEMFLGTNSVTFSDPAAAPLVTVTAQEGRALPAPQTTYSAPQVSPYYPGPAFDAFFAANDPTAAGAGYMNYGRLNNLASVTWPSNTTSVEAVLFGGGGSDGPAHIATGGGQGGGVKVTINDPEMGGQTWDMMVGGGGAQMPGEASMGGVGGGGNGGWGSGGGATIILDGEATGGETNGIERGGVYSFDLTPIGGSPPEGVSYGDTLDPQSAPQVVVGIGAGAGGHNVPPVAGISGGQGGFEHGGRGSDSISQSTSRAPHPTTGGGYSGGGALGPQPPFAPPSGTPANGTPGGNQTSRTIGGVAWPQRYFTGGGQYFPVPYNEIGGGGSGYRGGGGSYDSSIGYAGAAGGGAGFHNDTYVPAPSITAAPLTAAPSQPAEGPAYTSLVPTLPATAQPLIPASTAEHGSPGSTSLYGGDGGIYLSFTAQAINNTMTLVSDTFTANSTPTKARIVVFAELPDGTSDFAVSATRDNTTFNPITLTDTGYVSGSSGTKIFTGLTPLTGTASPQVQLRWKITGTSLTGVNKIHGVSLQWA